MSDRFRENTTVSRVAARKMAPLICLGLMAVLFSACGGGGGDAGAGGGSGTPTFPPVVFMADNNNDGSVELNASFDDGTNIIQLSETMILGGNVVDFKVSPNGVWVAYVADQDRDGLFELYVVPADKAPGESAVKVSVPLEASGIKLRSPGSGDFLFGWAPDSSRVAYIADADDSIADLFELFSSTPDGNDKILMSELVDPNSDVEDFQWAPDSILIAYVADQDTDGELELYVAPSNEEGASISVSGAIDGNGIKEDPVDSGEYAFAWAPGRCGQVPDNFCLAYIADQLLQDKFELFTAKPDGTLNRLISGPFGPNQDVVEFAWAPNSQLIAYTANQIDPFAIDLFSAQPNIATFPQINSSGVASGREVATFKWAPDSSRIAFISNKGVPGFFGLYTVQSVNDNDIFVSGSISQPSDVIEFKWSPDSSRIAYLVDAQEFELYTTFSDSGSSTQIGDLPVFFNGDVFEFKWAPDSSRIAYTADHDEAGVIELFSSTPENDVTDQISGTLVFGGDVGAFQWAPDSSGVGYIANQDTNNLDELYASQPDGNDNTLLSDPPVDDNGDPLFSGDVSAFEWVPEN